MPTFTAGAQHLDQSIVMPSVSIWVSLQLYPLLLAATDPPLVMLSLTKHLSQAPVATMCQRRLRLCEGHPAIDRLQPHKHKTVAYVRGIP